MGVDSIRLLTVTDNVPAREFWEELGYSGFDQVVLFSKDLARQANIPPERDLRLLKRWRIMPVRRAVARPRAACRTTASANVSCDKGDEQDRHIPVTASEVTVHTIGASPVPRTGASF